MRGPITAPKLIERAIVGLALIAAVAVAGCGGSSTHRPAATRVASPTPRATPTEPPSLRDLRKDDGVGIIEFAFNRLLDDHVSPVDEAAVLNAGWDGIRAAADREGVGVAAAPVFSGDRQADFAAFRSAYLSLPRGLRTVGIARYAAIDRMARSLNDCHTYYLGPSLDNEDLPPDQTLSDYGMTLAGKPAVVAGTDRFSPAATAGIERGDTILGIGDEDASDKNALDVLILLAGHERGDKVPIRVRRPGADADVKLTMKISYYSPPDVETNIIDHTIGYVRIRSWPERGVFLRLRDALARFEKAGIGAWVIDVRGNPGGRPDYDAISLFVREGVVVRTRERDNIVRDIPATGVGLDHTRPTVVLVDNGSASMSEIFALALKEHGVATIGGEKSYGCIGETLIDALGDGSGLAVSFGVMLGPVTGAELNGVGIAPDQAAPRTVDDIVAGRDPQLDAAITALRATLATPTPVPTP